MATLTSTPTQAMTQTVDIMLAPAKSQVIFHVEGTELVSRLIDGAFPNYQQVLPSSHSTRAVVDRDELLKAVRLSALIASSAAMPASHAARSSSVSSRQERS